MPGLHPTSLAKVAETSLGAVGLLAKLLGFLADGPRAEHDITIIGGRVERFVLCGEEMASIDGIANDVVEKAKALPNENGGRMKRLSNTGKVLFDEVQLLPLQREKANRIESAGDDVQLAR